jgi:hypothetical protein
MLGMWKLRPNKFEVPSIYVWRCRFQTDNTTAAVSHKGISQWYVIKCCDRIPCCQDRVSEILSASQSNIKPRERPFLPSCWNVLKPRETFLTQTVKADATWVHHFEPETKGQSMEWHHLLFPQKKKFKESVSREGNDHCLLGLWRSNSCGCNAEKGDSQLWHLYQDTHRTQEAFRTSLASQAPKRNLASAWQCKTTHKSEDSGSHQKIWLDSVTPSILQPWSSSLKFPPIQRPEESSMWYKVWD